MKTISIDIETFSSVDLSKCGVYKYAEAPDFEILLFGYSIDGGEVQVVDLASGEIVVAHCTIPLNMVRSYSFSTHFESGLGIGIHGEMEEGTVTILKMSGAVDRMFVQEALLEANQFKPNLCRTQLVLRIPEESRQAVLGDYFLKNPIGNHHIIVPGARTEVFEAYFQSVSQM